MLPPPSTLLHPQDLSPPSHHHHLPLPIHSHHSHSPQYQRPKTSDSSSPPSLGLSLTPRSTLTDLKPPASFEFYLDSHHHQFYPHHHHRKLSLTLANPSDQHSHPAVPRLGLGESLEAHEQSQSESQTEEEKEEMGFFNPNTNTHTHTHTNPNAGGPPPEWMAQGVYSAPASQSHFPSGMGIMGSQGLPPGMGLSASRAISGMYAGSGLGVGGVGVGSAPSTFHYGITGSNPNTSATSTAPYLEQRRTSVPSIDPSSNNFAPGLDEYLSGRQRLYPSDPYPHSGHPQSLHEIPTSPSRALGCFSSHSAQSTASISSTHSSQPLTPSASPKWGRSFGHGHGHEGGLGAIHPGAPAGAGSSSHPGGRSSVDKQYSFIALPGSHVRKRPRRRYDEIERLYECNWPGCTKAYGTLNHLNAHVHMQKHGQKRTPQEFKEMRKRWRAGQKMMKEDHQSMAGSHIQPDAHGMHHHHHPSSLHAHGPPGMGPLSLAHHPHHPHAGYNVHPEYRPSSTRGGLTVSIPGVGTGSGHAHHSQGYISVDPTHPHHPHQQYPSYGGGPGGYPHPSHTASGWMGYQSSSHPLAHPHPHRSISLRHPHDNSQDDLDLDLEFPPTSATSELVSPGGAWSNPTSNSGAPSNEFTSGALPSGRRTSTSISPIDERGPGNFGSSSAPGAGEWAASVTLSSTAGGGGGGSSGHRSTTGSAPRSGSNSGSGSGSGSAKTVTASGTGIPAPSSVRDRSSSGSAGRLPPDSTLLKPLQSRSRDPRSKKSSK